MAIRKVKDPIKLIQTAGDSYQGNEADQTYIISPSAIGVGEDITIIDQGGTNEIQFLDGLIIDHAVLVADEAVLTLSNGAVINVRGADTFTFNVGGNATTGTAGVEMTFAEFARDVLNAELPAAGADPVVRTGAATMNADGTVDAEGDMTNGLSVAVSGSGTQPENTEITAGTVVATVSIEAGTTYALSGTDSGMFALDATTGEITVTAAYTPDFETDPSYDFTVTATDADGVATTKDVTIAVGDIEPETGLPLELTVKDDSINEEEHVTDKGTATEETLVATATTGVKLTSGNDAINGPLEINGTTKTNTLNATDIIVDPSNTDADTLEADLIDDLGTGGGAGAAETGPTITDIENIILHGTQDVNAYSLKNVTSTAEDDSTTDDVNEGATISVSVDHGGTEKFTSSTDIDLSVAVSNVNGNDIKEVNLIEDTRSMAVSEISNNPAINLTNGEINVLTLDALDDAKLASEDVTVNLLDDKDGKLTLGLFDDDETADSTATHDGGGFENITLVTSDAAMNVTIADGSHLRNGTVANAIDTETDGFGASEADNGQIAQPLFGTAKVQDNLTDQLSLAGTKDITITGTDEQLDQAVIRDTLTNNATSTLALTLSSTNTAIGDAVPQAVNLTDAEVDLVKVDASAIDRHDLVPLTGDNLVRDFAQIAVDNDTTVEVNKIGDDGILNITGEAERTDNLDIIINTNSSDANLGRLILGGDDLTQSETATSGTAGDSTEAGSSNPATTQGVDANNAALHLNVTDSTLDQLDISALLGIVTIDGDKNLNIEDGGLIFDDTTVKFNEPNNFAANTAGDINAEGENVGAGFGGDWIDATEMTGDMNIILRDGTSNAVRAALINESVTPMSNTENGIRIDFGSGNDRITGLGTAIGPFATEAGDNVDMGAGRDEVIIGVNDTTTNILLNVPTVGSLQSGLNQVFNGIEDNDDTTVTAAEDTAAVVYNTAVNTAGVMAYGRINAEVYLDGPDGGSFEDHVIFRNQNSGFLADNNGVRIKDFEAGNNGDTMGFQMFQDGVEDGLPGTGKLGLDKQVSQQDLNLFNNGQVIADSDVAAGGKYVINGSDLNGDGLYQALDAADTGANDGNVVLVSTADIHTFTSSSASGLWAANAGGVGIPAGGGSTIPGGGSGLFVDVNNIQYSSATTNDGHQYETIVLVGETTGTDGVKIFYVTDEAAPDAVDPSMINDGVPTASLVGLLEGININDLKQDNFDFI